MAKVKMLLGFSGAVAGHYNVRSGDVLDVSDGVAFDLVAQGYASPVEEPRRKKTAKKTAVKVETASATPPEAAMRPKAEPRDG